MQVGVFLPINNNGWLISTTSPQYLPSFELNRAIVQRAERYGFDFALSMIKLHGFGGPSQFWDYGLESFTLMAGLAAVTTRIKLFASVAVLTLPPPITARMSVTIDSIAPGRFGVNIVSGWQEAEYSQMGIWPGSAHFARRYEYCAEYVEIMRELWDEGRSDRKGEFFTMDDCRLLPKPSARLPIICAGQSDRGTRFAAEYGDYNFCVGFGVNQPHSVAPSIARLVEATKVSGRDVGALVMTMVIADETDEAAMAKWQLYCDGVDREALAWRDQAAGADPSKDPYAQPNRHKKQGAEYPTNQGVMVGSYATVARLLDEMAEVPGLSGVMLTFDDFVQGMDDFGERIQPLMRSRTGAMLPA
ncbi:pyrimidine utilization protein A [Roseomonas populi]|uniref:Pyrimidine monooxygenase RutA n=1 Tax=Roseomonas populi TaxID=3121582 RepID=A0ABT1X9D5_9PROT|nr:pyrimidine utilization protein A [Roseomonas pecuniae]MCR0983747.1 pyrimidine utilization protein A [Roseomonas pecuniae]